MAVAEIPTLSGYQYDEEELQTLTDVPGIQRKEFEQDDTKINLYFNPVRVVSQGSVCLDRSRTRLFFIGVRSCLPSCRPEAGTDFAL